MSVLRNLESKLAGLVEGTFSRAFKSEVRPVEIARKLAREMEQHKVGSLSRTYAPERVRGLALAARTASSSRATSPSSGASCPATCSSTPAASASRCSTRPKIEFETDDALRLGEFGIQARLVRRAEEADADARARATTATRWSTRPSEPARRAAARARSAPPQRARCASTAAPSVLGSGGAVLGPLARRRRHGRRPQRLAPPRRGAAVRRLAGSCATSAPRTASRSTAGASRVRNRSSAATRSSSAPPTIVFQLENQWPSTPSPSRSSSASSPCCTCSCSGWRAPR